MWRVLRPDATAVLNDKKARKSLARYFSVMQNEKPAKFTIARKLPAEFNENDSIEGLWQKHARLTEEFHEVEGKIDTRQKNLKEMRRRKRHLP